MQLSALLVIISVLILLSLAVFWMVTTLAADIRGTLTKQLDGLRVEHANELNTVLAAVGGNSGAALEADLLPREATAVALDGPGQAALARVVELSEAQHNQVDQVAQDLRELTRRPAVPIHDLQNTLERRLAEIQVEQNRRFDEMQTAVSKALNVTVASAAAGGGEAGIALARFQETLLTRLEERARGGRAEADAALTRLQAALTVELKAAARVQQEGQDALAGRLAALAERSASAAQEVVSPGLNALVSDLGQKLDELRQQVAATPPLTTDGGAGREELTRVLNQTQEALLERLSAATQEQVGRIDRVAGELHQLAERPEFPVQELCDAIDSRLTRLETENNRKLDELNVQFGDELKAALRGVQEARAARAVSDGLAESLLARVGELAQVQKDQFGIVARELAALAARPQPSATDLRGVIEHRLEQLQAEHDRKLNELAEQIGQDLKAVLRGVQDARAARTLSDGLAESLLSRVAELAQGPRQKSHVSYKDQASYEDRLATLCGPRARAVEAGS